MDWIEKHKAECDKDSDTCNECFHISEIQWALIKAQEYMDNKNQQEKKNPKKEINRIWISQTKEWREV